MRNKRLDKGKTICVLIGDVSYDYTRELMRGINDAAEYVALNLALASARLGSSDGEVRHPRRMD